MTQNQDVLRLRINPDNRRVSVNDPEYIEAWTKALEVRREEIKTELREKLARGEIEIPVKVHEPDITVKLGDTMQSTPEEALHFRAHSQAVQEMQDWALRRGIGMVGMNSGWDHGQPIEYIDDPSVRYLDYEIEEEQAA